MGGVLLFLLLFSFNRVRAGKLFGVKASPCGLVLAFIYHTFTRVIRQVRQPCALGSEQRLAVIFSFFCASDFQGRVIETKTQNPNALWRTRLPKDCRVLEVRRSSELREELLFLCGIVEIVICARFQSLTSLKGLMKTRFRTLTRSVNTL